MTKTTQGWINGFIGVVIFAGSLPATRIAVAELNPFFMTSARTVLAAITGGLMLFAFKQPKPRINALPALLLTTLGVVIGFPLLSTLALRHITAANGLVFIGLLPLCTAGFAVLSGGERPRLAFWLFSLTGATCVISYALSGTFSGSLSGSLLMLAAVVLCGMGYAEGARLSRTLGGWQVISWALLLALPLALPIMLVTLPPVIHSVTPLAWAGLGYISFFSMLIGFLFWYRGLALGGIATVGQLQLLQPFIGLSFAALLLHETVSGSMVAVTLAAAVCVFGAKKYA